MRPINYVLVSIAIFLWGLIFISFSLAQDLQPQEAKKVAAFDSKATAQNWQEGIDQLKKSAEILLQENDKLLAEKDDLFKKIVEIQKSIAQIKKENAQLLSEPQRLNQLIETEKDKSKSFDKEARDLEKKCESLTKEKLGLEQQLVKIANQQKPLENEIISLNAQKSELVANLKLSKEISSSEVIGRLKSEAETLQNLLAESQKSEQDTRGIIAQRFKENASLAAAQQADMEKLERENDALSSQIVAVKSEKNKIQKELEVLEKKNIQIQDSQQHDVIRKKEQKTALENQITQQEASIAKLQGVKETSFSAKTEVQDLQDKVHQLDNDHQDLENRIFDLKEATMVLKRENAMAGALLDVQSKGISASSRLKEGVWVQNSVPEAMGYAYASQGQYAQAISQYQEALKKDSTNKDIYFNLGYIYYRMGNIDEAIKSYNNVLKIDPQDFEAKRNIAKLREERSRFKRAR